MKINKYRVIDIIFSSLLGLFGFIGTLLIPISQTYNIFLIIYISLNICLLPACFFLMLKKLYPLCTLVPPIFLLTLIGQLDYFEGENLFVWNLVLICQGISLIYATCTTIFIHSRKPIPKSTDTAMLSNKLSFRKNVLKRILLYIRDAVIVFVIAVGVLQYSNIALDTCTTVEFKVTVMDMSVRSRKYGRTLHVQYFGDDSRIKVTSITVPNHVGDKVSIGDEILLSYREGFYKDPYFWIVE